MYMIRHSNSIGNTNGSKIKYRFGILSICCILFSRNDVDDGDEDEDDDDMMLLLQTYVSFGVVCSCCFLLMVSFDVVVSCMCCLP
jgi:hypothetical protein